MSPREMFKLYFGINLHFTNETYSMVKYGANTKRADAAFEALSRSQKFRFESLGQKLNDTQNGVYACIGCQFSDINLPHDTMDDVLSAYYELKSRREGMDYSLSSQLSKFNDESPTDEKLVYKYLIGSYTPEFVLCVVSDHSLRTMYSVSSMAWARPKLLKLIKYKSFFSIKKYAHLFEVETTV